jgi:hypothetical protein
MKPSRVRLAVCALLFLGWIGWLVYLSATTTRPVVLSRPQFLAADLYVLAELQQGREPRLRAEIPAQLSAAPAAGFPAAVPWGPVGQSTLPPKADAEPATVNAPAARVKIREVVWPASAGDLNGKDLVIPNLPRSGPAQGWAGPGEYILPLTRQEEGRQATYLVTPIPRSPGYYGAAPDPRTPGRIYRATAATRRELDDLKKEFHGRGQ